MASAATTSPKVFFDPIIYPLSLLFSVKVKIYSFLRKNLPRRRENLSNTLRRIKADLSTIP